MPPNGPTGTIALNEPAPHHYGDHLTFTTTSSHARNPMIEVALWQDVDASGTVDEELVSHDLVDLQLDHADQTFVAGGSGSRADTSLPAKGRARLLNYAWKGGQETVTLLDSLDFDVVP